MSDECPYGANDCPKFDDVKRQLEIVSKSLINLNRVVYVMCGIIMAEFGVMIW